MTPEEFVEAVRTAQETPLSRLGSSKALYAATEGDIEAQQVLRAAADAEHAASETFAAWADTETETEVRELFEVLAAEEREHYETVVEAIDGDHEPADDVPAVHAYLRDLEGTVERLGGFVGRTLASDASKGQMTGYFTGQADPQTASLFRDLRGDLDAQLERAIELLGATCESDADWERAREAAEGAIEAAYAEYTETLEGMGVNPKPVC